jgi:hypothetical protein
MAGHDPSDTGGLFVGPRPGRAPVRVPKVASEASERRQRADRALAAMILGLETLLCLSLFGPQPAAWLWIGSQVEYLTGYVSLGFATIIVGCLSSLMLTLAAAKRLDHAWKLTRRAGGYRQERGAIEWIFAASVGVALVVFGFWFLVIQGPAPTLAPST